MKPRVRPYVLRVLTMGLAALALTAALLEFPAHSRGAGTASVPSSNVAVVPGFAPKPYSGNTGVPPLPVNAPELAKYHFSELPAANITPAALQGYDTVLLYQIRWSDISSSGQAAINSFAATHKVVIWDSDATGPQAYSTFVHPFSTLSSGQNFKGKPNDAVVSFPTGTNFLASSQPSSPYYLDPYQLVHDGDELVDMNAMVAGAKDWAPALVAANGNIPGGGWVVAWSYGDVGQQTGMTIYSGIDADSFTSGWKMNNVKKELALDLAAPYSTAPAPCAPGCQPPPVTEQNPYTICGFAKPLPRHWVHRSVPVTLKTSVATDITGQAVTRSGRVVAKATAGKAGLLRLAVNTKRLPTNRTSQLQALIFYKGKQACSKPFRLRVDNTRPRLLQFATSRGSADLLTLKVSEKSWLKVIAPHVHWRTRLIPGRKTIHLSLPASVRAAQLILTDRAHNTAVRRLTWR